MKDDIPPLTNQYHKARNSLAFFSAILLAWSLIGITITEKTFSNVSINVKNPNILPAILSFLVSYFSLRFLVEWYQCDLNRRNNIAAKADFLSTLFLAGAAIWTSATQTISKEPPFGMSLKVFTTLQIISFLGIIIFISGYYIINALKPDKEFHWMRWIILIGLFGQIYIFVSFFINIGRAWAFGFLLLLFLLISYYISGPLSIWIIRKANLFKKFEQSEENDTHLQNK
ncbi:MAG: hypothetical protein ABR936_15660 [Bacteroidota bacterium]